MGLKELYESRGFPSRASFQRASGVSYQTIWRTELHQSDPETPTIDRFAAALGISNDDVLRAIREVETPEATRVPPAPFQIPVRAIVMAGPESEAVEIPDAPIGWEPTSEPPRDGLEALELHGESMEPALFHGDRIIVDHRQTSADGDIVLAEHRDGPDSPPELTVKLLERREDGFWLVPLNPACKFKPQPYDGRHWQIRAVVVKFIGRNVRGRFRWLAPDREKTP